MPYAIKNLKIYGDFFGHQPVHSLEERFKDRRYHPEDITIALEGVDLEEYFGKIEKKEFEKLVYGADKV